MLKGLLLSTLISSVSAQGRYDPQAATAQSLLYGYPLLAWQKFYAPTIAESGPNVFNHADSLATPANRTVVKPNRDTLYSTLIYDLSQSDVEITIPDGPDSFKLFSFYDPYGTNFANVGTSGFFQPGKYLIRPGSTSGDNSNGLQTVNGSDSDYVAFVNSPTSYGTLLVRWGVEGDSVDGLAEWQDRTSAEAVPRTDSSSSSKAPPLESLVDIFDPSASAADNVLNLLAVFAPASASAVSLEASGITNGEYLPISGVNLTQANASALSMALSAATNPDNLVNLNNDWSIFTPDLMGIYNDNYALRALISLAGYLALRDPYAIYPTLDTSNRGALTLEADEALLFTFSGPPPLKEQGFWSLTAYGSDEYLIENDAGVYALGAESGLSFADGSPVYGSDGSSAGGDQPFQILVQAADARPPSNWTSNWLPAPAGGGEVLPLLRFYGAGEALTDGGYVYPEMTRVAAMLGTNGTAGSGNGSLSGDGEPPVQVDAGAAMLPPWFWLAMAGASALAGFYVA